ncbi:MAG: hypothetical protein CMQ70_00455 [Gammaproteobacteria bacterium]|nr:hypothetical protein [Gammaproteobacteria bacterium]
MLDIILNLVVGILLLFLAKGNAALKKIRIFNNFSFRVCLMMMGGLVIGFALGDFLIWLRL